MCDLRDLEGECAEGQLSGNRNYGAFYTMIRMWIPPSVLEAKGELTTHGY